MERSHGGNLYGTLENEAKSKCHELCYLIGDMDPHAKDHPDGLAEIGKIVLGPISLVSRAPLTNRLCSVDSEWVAGQHLTITVQHLTITIQEKKTT
jgi:hypothetical protein